MSRNRRRPSRPGGPIEGVDRCWLSGGDVAETDQLAGMVRRRSASDRPPALPPTDDDDGEPVELDFGGGGE